MTLPSRRACRQLPALALAGLVLAGCTDEAATPLATARFDTLPNGIVQVTNSGPTAWADTNGWRIVEERVIAPQSGSPGEIGDPDGVAIGDDGSVYLMQRKPHAIKVYGPDGTFLRNIGRDGEGPGEFRMGYIGVHGDTIALQDPALYRFTTYLADGTLLQSRAAPGDWVSSYLDIDRQGRAAVPGGVAGSDGYYGVMLRITMNGTVLDTIIVPEDDRPRKMWRASWVNAQGRTMNMRMSAPLQPQMHQRYRSDGLLVYGTTDKPELILSRTGRDTSLIIRTSTPTIAITPAQGDSLFKANLDGMEWKAEWLLEGSRADVPATWPPWTTFGVDRRGHIWLGIPGTQGGVAAAQVFDSSGVLLGTVPLPHPRVLAGSWGGDRIALLDETAEGFSIVRIFRLERHGK